MSKILEITAIKLEFPSIRTGNGYYTLDLSHKVDTNTYIKYIEFNDLIRVLESFYYPNKPLSKPEIFLIKNGHRYKEDIDTIKQQLNNKGL